MGHLIKTKSGKMFLQQSSKGKNSMKKDKTQNERHVMEHSLNRANHDYEHEYEGSEGSEGSEGTEGSGSTEGSGGTEGTTTSPTEATDCGEVKRVRRNVKSLINEEREK